MPSADLKDQRIQEGELLRPNEWSQSIAGLVAFFAVAIGLLLLLTNPVQGSNITGQLRPVYGLIWIVFGLMLVSRLTAGLVVEENGVIVRSRFRSAQYQWAEIKEFVFRPSFIRRSLVIEFQDGRKIGVHGFGVRSVADRQRAEGLVSELNNRAAASH